MVVFVPGVSVSNWLVFTSTLPNCTDVVRLPNVDKLVRYALSTHGWRLTEVLVVVFVVLSYTDTTGSQSASWPLIQNASPMIWPELSVCAQRRWRQWAFSSEGYTNRELGTRGEPPGSLRLSGLWWERVPFLVTCTGPARRTGRTCLARSTVAKTGRAAGRTADAPAWLQHDTRRLKQPGCSRHTTAQRAACEGGVPAL